MSFIDVWEALNLLLNDEEGHNLQVTVTSRGLRAEEAIGRPERRDFPLLREKEVLVQAAIDGHTGQAFTGDPVVLSGRVRQVVDGLTPGRPGHRALAVAVLNALARKLGIADHTVHCTNQEPEECAQQVSAYLREMHGSCRVGIIGYQPALLQHCAEAFGPDRVCVTDLNPDLVGRVRYGVEVWDGMKDTARLVGAIDILLVTGTVLANGTYEEVLEHIGDKPYYFFGTTCAALAAINKVNRLCPMSK